MSSSFENRLSALSSRSVDGPSIDVIVGTAKRRRRRKAIGIGAGGAAGLLVLAATAAIVVSAGGGGREQVRAGVPIAASPCLRPGPDHTIGYASLRDDQTVALIKADLVEHFTPSDVIRLGGTILLTTKQYEALRIAGEPIDVSQLAQMGYDLSVSGPATTAPTTTTAPSPTTALPEGTTPFEAWASVLRDRGLLTPEQEAEIAAGRGISLATDEQRSAIDEAFPPAVPTPNGPVAELAAPGGKPGPPICSTR